MTTTDTPATSDAVRAALLDLLSTGQHHHAATPATLTAVGQVRQALATGRTRDSAGRWGYPDRLAALAVALGEVATALDGCHAQSRHPDPTQLHSALTGLAALALGWLDATPPPPTASQSDDQSDESEPPW